jgi:hypothetical protein
MRCDMYKYDESSPHWRRNNRHGAVESKQAFLVLFLFVSRLERCALHADNAPAAAINATHQKD